MKIKEILNVHTVHWISNQQVLSGSMNKVAQTMSKKSITLVNLVEKRLQNQKI